MSHTGRELELMLAGRKPLAMFTEALSFLPEEDFIPEVRFSKYVESGLLLRKEFVAAGSYSDKLGRDTTSKTVFFAVKGAEWRIDVLHLLMKQLQFHRGWNETCERMECFLRGYSEEEADAWCKKMYPKYNAISNGTSAALFMFFECLT